eukprot:1160146-Pelagomonas_calceolata.AAC.9
MDVQERGWIMGAQWGTVRAAAWRAEVPATNRPPASAAASGRLFLRLTSIARLHLLPFAL